jgi:hypothetical protein
VTYMQSFLKNVLYLPEKFILCCLEESSPYVSSTQLLHNIAHFRCFFIFSFEWYVLSKEWVWNLSLCNCHFMHSVLVFEPSLVHSLPCFSLFTRINSKWIRDLHVKFLFIVLLDGSIMEFTKVLILYQIYYNWIHPLYHSPLSLPPVLGIFSTGLIFPFTYTWHSICTTFTLPLTFPTSTPHIGTNLPHKTCSALLSAIFVKKK